MKKIQKKAKLNGNTIVSASNSTNGNNNCSGAESGNSCSSSGLLQSTIKDEQCSKCILYYYTILIFNTILLLY